MKSLRDAMGPMLGRVAKATGTGATLTPIWVSLVGEVLARHTRPRSLTQGVLTITCDGRAWKEALEPEAASLLPKLRAALGGEVSLRALVFECP